jgi:diazepam-binding inhibitor (GABA receptor modulating acyl-CoA-binding protein)
MLQKVSQTLRIKFQRASKKVQKLSSKPSNEFLLKLYALYKQANEGDCVDKASGGIRDRAKWKAWNSILGTSEFDAMTKYCEVVDQLVSMD